MCLEASKTPVIVLRLLYYKEEIKLRKIKEISHNKTVMRKKTNMNVDDGIQQTAYWSMLKFSAEHITQKM